MKAVTRLHTADRVFHAHLQWRKNIGPSPH